MTLDDLAHQRPYAKDPRVPEWTLGCFRRRCITYATGAEDAATQVIWIQSHGMTADIRVPKARPALMGRDNLLDCSVGELTELVKAEGFAARSVWRDGLMYWDAFATFQPYDKWPEPGRLERVGTSLIEWAPSGAYVEDWRLQARCSGLCVGLRLQTETRLDGVERPREGGIVIAGDHAIMVVARRAPLNPGRLHELIAVAETPKALARTAFDCEVSYALKNGDDYRVALSVDPFANGSVLFPGGFELGNEPNELIQRPGPNETWSLRRWKIDTLLPDRKRPPATQASPEGLAWIKAEKDTLL